MNYTDAQYMQFMGFAEPSVIRVIIDGVECFVPIDTNNTDYKNMMELVAEGKLTISPAEPPKSV